MLTIEKGILPKESKHKQIVDALKVMVKGDSFVFQGYSHSVYNAIRTEKLKCKVRMEKQDNGGLRVWKL